MLPTKSNTADTGCSPVSSNCVIWQGPAIACLNLCTGDSISDVTYKLALEVCDLKSQLDLTDLGLDCLVNDALRRVDPEQSLSYVLDLLIAKVCSIDDIINGVSEDNGSVTLDPIITIPQNATCFYRTDENGNTVTELQHSIFTKRIAVEICALKTLTTSHTNALTNHESRITVLENKPSGSSVPLVTPTCTFPTTTDVAIDVAWEALEQQFCQLRSITGTPTALSAALTYQCQSLGSVNALSATGTMSNLPGWKNQVSTVADALQNMFITICDMRASLNSALTNGGTGAATGCAATIVDFTITLNDARTSATLFFAGLTSLPTNATECTAEGAKLTITDSSGGKYTTYVSVTDNKANTNGVIVPISGLNPSLNYTFVLDACFDLSGSQCVKQVTKQVPVNCSLVTAVTASFV